MSTVCAEAAPCEQQEQVELDFPLPFSELPPDLQEAAIESYRNMGRCWDYDDNERLQEDLGEVLNYEFGIEPEYETFKGKDGKNHRGNPRIFWNQCNHVEFEIASFDIDEVLKHSGHKETLDREFGTCYYRPEAKELAVLLHAVEMIELGMDWEFNASYRLKPDEKHDHYDRCDWEWPDGHPYDAKNATQEYKTAAALFDRIEAALKDYYEAACSRLKKIIEDTEEYQYSDEGVRETLEANDHWEFDECGDLV
jgi:hypothetical protein